MARLIVDPLTRVEGHGRVELLLRDGRLDDVKVRLLESPRLFEALVTGHRYDAVPELVCRVCAICSAVHKLASLQALENAMGVTVPPTAAMLRELLLLGEHLQSHVLHLFCLILPDLREVPDILMLLKQGDPLAVGGLAVKAFGNRIQEIAGGRVIHPVNPVFGGVAYRPGKDELETLAVELERWQRDWPELAAGFEQAGHYPAAGTALGSAIATGLADSFALSGELLWYEPSACAPVAEYVRLLGERSRPETYAKDAAGASGPFLVGALARNRLAAARGVPVGRLADGLGIHANNLAQVREVDWILQRIGQLLDALLGNAGTGPLRAGPVAVRGGKGTAVMEAPRGLLVHHYVVDEWGTVVAADIVTPTAINQRVIAAQVLADLADEADPARMRQVTERIVRAYDPCISCAVHLLPASGDGA
jgi:coenzyme F420-reducing hydrogenase alpha subunit